MSTRIAENRVRNSKGTSRGFLLPICLIPFISLIMKGHQYDTKLGDYAWFGISTQVDFFLYYKMIAIISIAILMVALLITYIMREKPLRQLSKREWMQWIPLLIYLVFALISTMASEYAYFGFHGGYEQFESIWVILGYGIMIFYVFQFIQDSEDFNFVMIFFLIAVCMICLIGTFQFLGHDFFTLDFIKRIISPDGRGDISFNFEKGRTYSTLYNPNYVGVFAVLILPLMATLAVFSKNRIIKIFSILGVVLTTCSLIGSKSKSGLLVTAVCFFVLFMMMWRNLVKNRKVFIIVLAVGIALGSLAFILRGEEIVTVLKAQFQTRDTSVPQLDGIKTGKKEALMTYGGNTMHIQYDMSKATLEDAITLTDENGGTIEKSIDPDEHTVTITDTRFPGFIVSLVALDQDHSMYGISINYGGCNYVFTQTANGYRFYTPLGKLTEVDSKQIKVFQPLVGHESLASRRGFIWSRTIPMLSQRIILGTGADSFTVTYPNDDYAGAWQNNYYCSIMTKPHSLYLQIFCQSGLISLIGFLLMIGIYTVGFFRVWNTKASRINQDTRYFAGGIFVGIIGFMIMALTNDSSICVTPIFCLFLGIGLSFNHELIRRVN